MPCVIKQHIWIWQTAAWDGFPEAGVFPGEAGLLFWIYVSANTYTYVLNGLHVLTKCLDFKMLQQIDKLPTLLACRQNLKTIYLIQQTHGGFCKWNLMKNLCLSEKWRVYHKRNWEWNFRFQDKPFLNGKPGVHLDKDTTSIPRWLLLNRYSRRAG